jgi:hypothetical protein
MVGDFGDLVRRWEPGLKKSMIDLLTSPAVIPN